MGLPDAGFFAFLLLTVGWRIPMHPVARLEYDKTNE
jgi:hypothetical protein